MEGKEKTRSTELQATNSDRLGYKSLTDKENSPVTHMAYIRSLCIKVIVPAGGTALHVPSQTCTAGTQFCP